jgi:hypothetical protein
MQLRSIARAGVVLLSIAAPLTACSNDDADDEASDSTEAPSGDSAADDTETSSDDTGADASAAGSDASITFATSDGAVSFLGTPSSCDAETPSSLELEGDGNGYTISYSSGSGTVSVTGAGEFEGESSTVTITERPDGGVAFLVVGDGFDLSGTC